MAAREHTHPVGGGGRGLINKQYLRNTTKLVVKFDGKSLHCLRARSATRIHSKVNMIITSIYRQNLSIPALRRLPHKELKSNTALFPRSCSGCSMKSPFTELMQFRPRLLHSLFGENQRSVQSHALIIDVK